MESSNGEVKVSLPSASARENRFKQAINSLKSLGKPKLTPEQQATNDLARELIRAAELKDKPERDAREQAAAAGKVREAEILSKMGQVQDRITAEYQEVEKARVAKQSEILKRQEAEFAQTKKAEEQERQERLTRVRNRVDQLRSQNDEVEQNPGKK